MLSVFEIKDKINLFFTESNLKPEVTQGKFYPKYLLRLSYDWGKIAIISERKSDSPENRNYKIKTMK